MVHAIELTWYVHWVSYYQKWELGFNEKDAHPWYEYMGCFGHGCPHARGPMEEVVNKPCLFNKPN